MGGSEGVLEYTQVDGCPNADHAEQVVRTAATNHGAWWNQPFVGDEVQGLMRYSETTMIFPLIQRILKDRWGELKRLVSDPSQGDRWSDMPMEAEVVDAFGERACLHRPSSLDCVVTPVPRCVSDLFVEGDNCLKVLNRPKPITLCHGDTRIENFLWQKNADGPVSCATIASHSPATS